MSIGSWSAPLPLPPGRVCRDADGEMEAGRRGHARTSVSTSSAALTSASVAFSMSTSSTGTEVYLATPNRNADVRPSRTSPSGTRPSAWLIPPRGRQSCARAARPPDSRKATARASSGQCGRQAGMPSSALRPSLRIRGALCVCGQLRVHGGLPGSTCVAGASATGSCTHRGRHHRIPRYPLVKPRAGPSPARTGTAAHERMPGSPYPCSTCPDGCRTYGELVPGSWTRAMPRRQLSSAKSVVRRSTSSSCG